MTTLRDLLNDLIIESMQFGTENNVIYNEDLAKDKREELLDQYTLIIKERIVG